MSGSKRLQDALDAQEPCCSKQVRLEDENNNTILSTTNEDDTNDSIATAAVAEEKLPVRLSNANRVSLTNRPRSSLPVYPGRESSTDDSILNASRLVQDNSLVRTQLESLEMILSKQFNPQLAFNYDFINHVSEFIRRGPEVDMKLLARALQAATKLYTSKIDLYIRDATKISSTLSMITEEEENELGLFDDNNRNNNNRRRRVKKSGKTLVSNLATINCREVEVNQLTDPLFHHVSNDFEVGNVNCLLMPTLHTDPNGLILFRSEDNLDFSSLPLPQRKMINASYLPMRRLFAEEHFESRSTCAPFGNFDFLNRNLNEQVEFNSQQSSFLMRPFDDYHFDLDAPTEDVTNAVDNAPDFNFDEIDHHDVSVHRRATVADPQIVNQNADLLDILPENDNHFFNRNFLKRRFRKASAFAWLHRNMPAANRSRSSSLSSVAPIRQRRQRQMRQPNTYQAFEADDDAFLMLNSNLEDQRKTRHIYRAPNYDHRMAHDRGFHPIKLRQFFTKERTFFKKFAPKRVSGLDDRTDRSEHNEDNHEEANLVDDIFDEHISPGDISANANEPYATPSGPPVYSQELDYVDPLDIDYVKVAKRVDMKRVKKCIWNAIQSESMETSSMSSELTNLPSSSSYTSGKMISFEKLNQRLPAYMDPNVHQNLSLANKFVALLHLCNDKSLALGSQEPQQLQKVRSDFNIFSELS